MAVAPLIVSGEDLDRLRYLAREVRKIKPATVAQMADSARLAERMAGILLSYETRTGHLLTPQ